ncbi:TIGR02206 family membrane protein [Halobacillus shinanisalinarum]|uniref:TIGR02206 family membrane protein n=1 Tax=Halobacillus shinanisalinarum TaxID=2932258 RepID=A0ABY4H3K7_9BACI|nr:TIGR02206 family membrane protein [Halobacillus shinanisalinarum]UOQ95036.1 TIGR02206 family membrane protein [Halobacillus shinanisalinarum]
MKQWFGPWIDQPFHAFGTAHLFMLVVFSLGMCALWLFSSQIKKETRTHHVIRWALFALLFTCEASYQIWTVVHQVFSPAEHLPLHLCGIASLFAMIGLLTYNKKLIQINFFIGIAPALLALITPDIPHGYEHFRFWKFFIHHMAIPWASLFLVVTTNVSINRQIMLETYGYLVLYSITVGFVNKLIGSNYLYLSGPPAASTPLDYLGEGVWYYLHLSLLALLVFSFMLCLYRAGRFLR